MFNVEGMQQVSLEYDQKANVLFYDIEALAGNGLATMKNEQVVERWHIPSLIGEHIAVSISGNSMEPTLKDGDKVIAKRVLSAADIRHNTIYILVYDGAPVIKRVHLVPGGLELRSDNVFYAAVIADVTLVGDMYLVVGYYRDMGVFVV
jgi:phage repressor protein C with HTH and peptisase S24 domain